MQPSITTPLHRLSTPSTQLGFLVSLSEPLSDQSDLASFLKVDSTGLVGYDAVIDQAASTISLVVFVLDASQPSNIT